MKRRSFSDAFWHPNARIFLAFSHHARKILAFSMIELMISLITISLIAAAMTPVITKKAKLQVSASNSFKCPEDIGPDCTACIKGICIACNLDSCGGSSSLNKLKCKCIDCSGIDPNCIDCSETECKQCADGYYLKPDGKCERCSLGHYCPDGKRQEQCTKGHYCDEEGLKDQKDCGAGYYCDSNGMTDRKNCTAGNYCPGPNDENQTPCPKGSYCPSSNMNTPKACEAGYYCPNEGMTNHTDCGAGYYCPNSGMSTRNDCDKGYYCPGNNSKEQKLCDNPSDSYQNEKNKTSCKHCTNGKVSSDRTTCIACTGGTTPNSDHTACEVGVTCTSKQYLDSATLTCKPCPTECKSCTSATVCTECETGYYLSGTTCKPCPDNCTTCTSGTVCTGCKTGYYLDGSSCKSCTDKWGKSCTQCTKDKCTSCDSNHKLNSQGKCVLDSCPNNANIVKENGLCIDISTGAEGDTKAISTSTAKSAGITVLSAMDAYGAPDYEINSHEKCTTTGGCCWNGLTGQGHTSFTPQGSNKSVDNSWGVHPLVCDYTGAKKYCEYLASSNYGGISTWRLPTKEELDPIPKLQENGGHVQTGSHNSSMGSSGSNPMLLCANSNPVYYCPNGCSISYYNPPCGNSSICNGSSSCNPYEIWLSNNQIGYMQLRSYSDPNTYFKSKAPNGSTQTATFRCVAD